MRDGERESGYEKEEEDEGRREKGRGKEVSKRGLMERRYSFSSFHSYFLFCNYSKQIFGALTHFQTTQTITCEFESYLKK